MDERSRMRAFEMQSHWAMDAVCPITAFPEAGLLRDEIESCITRLRGFGLSKTKADLNTLVLTEVKLLQEQGWHGVQALQFMAICARHIQRNEELKGWCPNPGSLVSGAFWQRAVRTAIDAGLVSADSDWRRNLLNVTALSEYVLVGVFSDSEGYWCGSPTNGRHTVSMNGVGVVAMGPAAARAAAFHEYLHAMMDSFWIKSELEKQPLFRKMSSSDGDFYWNFGEDLAVNAVAARILDSGKQDMAQLYKGWIVAAAHALGARYSLSAEAQALAMARITGVTPPWEPTQAAAKWLESCSHLVDAFRTQGVVPINSRGAPDPIWFHPGSEKDALIHARASAIVALTESFLELDRVEEKTSNDRAQSKDKDRSIGQDQEAGTEEKDKQQSDDLSKEREPAGTGPNNEPEAAKGEEEKGEPRAGNQEGDTPQDSSDALEEKESSKRKRLEAYSGGDYSPSIRELVRPLVEPSQNARDEIVPTDLLLESAQFCSYALRSFESEYRSEIYHGERLFRQLRDNALKTVRNSKKLQPSGEELDIRGLIEQRIDRSNENIFRGNAKEIAANYAKFLLIIDASASMTLLEGGVSRFCNASCLALACVLAIEKAGYETGIGFFSDMDSQSPRGCILYGPESPRGLRRNALALLASALLLTREMERTEEMTEDCETPLYALLPGGKNFMSGTSAAMSLGVALKPISELCSMHKPGSLHGLIFTDGEFEHPDESGNFERLKTGNPRVSWSILCHPQVHESAVEYFGENHVGEVDLNPGFILKVFNVFSESLTRDGTTVGKAKLKNHFKRAIVDARSNNLNSRVQARALR